MTEKAEKIYDEIESHFQEGYGALEVDMLLNLSYMLSTASDEIKKNPYNIIDVSCRGFECYHQQKTLSADNSCSCCMDSIFFGCEVDEDNDAVAQRMLEYCRSDFVNISQK